MKFVTLSSMGSDISNLNPNSDKYGQNNDINNKKENKSKNVLTFSVPS